MAKRRSAHRPTTNRSIPIVSTTVGADQRTLTQRIRIGDTPPLQGVPSVPGTVQTVHANLQAEYVSAGGLAWYANLARSLPWSIDDVTRDFGDDLYERMALDGQIASLINYFKAAVLEDDYSILPVIDDETDSQHGAAVACADWCAAALDALRPNLATVLWDMADAVLVGNRVAELVWHLADDADGKPALLLKAIKPKPRRSVAFVTDAYYNLLGVTALTPGMPLNVQPDLLISDLNEVPNFLPRDKVAVLTFRMKNCDPRGSSIARPAYNAWNLKMQAWPEYLKYIAQFATPSLIGTTPENALAEYQDQQGNPLATPITPEQAQVATLATIRNGAVVSLPFGCTVKALEMTGNGDAFRQFIDLQDRGMAKAILSQTLATEEGKHQTRAASSSHQDVVDTLVRQSKRWIEAMIREDILTPLLRYNRPAWLSVVPTVSLGRTEQRDFGSMATGIAALETSGYLGASQRPGIDEMLGLPERDAEADQAAEDAALPPALPAPAPIAPIAASGESTPSGAGQPRAVPPAPPSTKKERVA